MQAKGWIEGVQGGCSLAWSAGIQSLQACASEGEPNFASIENSLHRAGRLLQASAPEVGCEKGGKSLDTVPRRCCKRSQTARTRDGQGLNARSHRTAREAKGEGVQAGVAASGSHSSKNGLLKLFALLKLFENSCVVV
jgi:hypothetical protein